MRGIFSTIAGAALAIFAGTAVAQADDRAVVEAFYSQLLSSASATDVTARAEKIMAPTWESIGDYSGKNK